MGISRSSTITIAYLMRKHMWSYKQAIEYVSERRRIIDPNEGFKKQLQRYEKLLNNRQRRNIHRQIRSILSFILNEKIIEIIQSYL